MHKFHARPRLRTTAALLALYLLASAPVVRAASTAHLSRAQAGGMPGLPLITGINPATNGVTITWDGPAGDYQLFQKAKVTDPQWRPIGEVINHQRASSVSAPSKAGIFTISGPSPHYVGMQACLECHSPVAENVSHTRHSTAFNTSSFVALGGQTDVSCLPCHTVGFGVPTGFLSPSRTPQLANVQCENCHGPAGRHAANPEDPVTRPRVEISSVLCGGCHNASAPARVASLHPARFEEWNASGHRAVVPDVKGIFESPTVTSSTIATCGACHSGTVREALLEDQALPSGHEAASIGIACATCHDAHEQTVHANVLDGLQTNLLTGFVITNRSLGAFYTNQISSPLASLVDYHTKGAFATNYNPEVNICAQCHNDRGASAKNLDRPPHHSAQYNMLLGSFSEEDTTIPA